MHSEDAHLERRPRKRRSAVSYSRFSSPRQTGGDSQDRQDRMYRAFCERHNLTPGKEAFADRGRSGWSKGGTGAHRRKGRLGDLVQAAKDGAFDPGTVIVIEAWDRLGRMRADLQINLLQELLRTGVSVGVCKLDDIFSEDDFGDAKKWLTLALFIQLAHDESLQKSERVSSAWAKKRQRAREAGTPVVRKESSLPAWMAAGPDGGRPRLIPARAATLKRLFQLAAEGLGCTRICKALAAERREPFRRVYGRTVCGRWDKSYVSNLLRDRRVLGEFQPHKGGKPDGPPIPGFFDAAVTEPEWNLARAGQERRRTYDARGRAGGPRQSKHVNVFRSILTDARGGGGFQFVARTDPKHESRLMSDDGRQGRTPAYSFPYYPFEEGVLSRLREVKAESVLPRDPDTASKIELLRATLRTVREDLAQAKADLKKPGGYSSHRAEVMDGIAKEELRIDGELRDELARTPKTLRKTWEDLPNLVDLVKGADDPEAVRLRLRPVLQTLIDEARLLIVCRGKFHFAAVQFYFTGGESVRHYLLTHRSADRWGPAKPQEAVSFAAAGLPADLDLRTPADVALVEAELGRIGDELVRERTEVVRKAKLKRLRERYAAMLNRGLPAKDAKKGRGRSTRKP